MLFIRETQETRTNPGLLLLNMHIEITYFRFVHVHEWNYICDKCLSKCVYLQKHNNQLPAW